MAVQKKRVMSAIRVETVVAIVPAARIRSCIGWRGSGRVTECLLRMHPKLKVTVCLVITVEPSNIQSAASDVLVPKQREKKGAMERERDAAALAYKT